MQKDRIRRLFTGIPFISTLLVLTFTCNLPSASSSSSSSSLYSEVRLVKDLFANYDRSVRPKADPSEPVYVGVKYNLLSLLSVNEKTETIVISGWFELRWQDSFMTWNPDDYEGITFISVPPSLMWLPDLIFETSLSDDNMEKKRCLLRIDHFGNVVWEPLTTNAVSCHFDLRKYPIDFQTCTILVSTWSTTGDKIHTYGIDIDLHKFVPNGEWNVVKGNYMNNTYYDEETEEAYTEVWFNITLNRKPLHQILYVLFPTFLLGIINMFMFYLPVKSEEKINLAATVLVAFSVWLKIMIDMMPSSSDDVSYVGIYLNIYMIMSSLSVIVAALVVRLHRVPADRPIPSWVIRAFGVCRKIRHLRGTCRKRVIRVMPKGSIVGDHDECVDWMQISAAVDDFFLVFSFLFIVILTVVTAVLLVSD